MRTIAALLFACVFPGPALADGPPQIRFVSMQGNKAVLMIDRRMHRLEPGQKSRSGVKLLHVNRREAVVQVDGTPFRYRKGSDLGTPLTTEVALKRTRNGMFIAPGKINGKPVDFMVDTGATFVVLSADDARRMKLRYRTNNPIRITTASRVEVAYGIVLDTVSVGGIIQNKVPAVVTRGKFPNIPLLGMSFLGRLEISQNASQMTLRE